LSRELLGYNSDAASVLWEQVTHHESQKKNAIGGVYRGIGDKLGFILDSAFVPLNRNISFHFENPNELIFQFELKNNENSDTIISSKKEHVDFTFKSIGQYEWKLYPASKFAESKSKTLFVISEEEYQKKLNRYEKFRAALSDLEDELQEELLELYLETDKLGYLPERLKK
jgi:DNA mismatch repair ATPase MutS